MSTSMIYHAWGAKGYTLKSTTYDAKGTTFTLEPQRRLYICPQCKSKDVTTRGSIDRIIQSVPVGFAEKVYFKVKVPRVDCKNCGGLHYIDLQIADARKSYTKQLARFVYLLFSIATVSAIARCIGLNWQIVKDIVKSFLEKKYSKPDLRGLTLISIDEISIGKNHKYLTVVINAATGDPIYVGQGKGESALDDFWKLLGKRRAKRIKAVAIDMGRSYIAAVKKHLPNALIVFDHFHVIKLVNETLDLLRRKVQSTLSLENSAVIKGTKFLLLSNQEDLTEEKKNRLQQLLDLNTILTAAYILKEDIRQLWSQDNLTKAQKALNVWLKTARSTGEPLLIKLANTIEKHQEGILNWYKYRINSGRIEGINNKIKTMTKQAYGYRDIDFLKLLIMAILHGKSRMVIAHKT